MNKIKTLEEYSLPKTKEKLVYKFLKMVRIIFENFCKDCKENTELISFDTEVIS